LSINALVAADAFSIPVTPSYLSLEGIVSLGNVVRTVRRQIGEAAPVLGVVLTMVDHSQPDTADAIAQLRDHYGGKVFDVEIAQDPAIQEAPSHGQDLFSYAPDSQGAADYRTLLGEIEERLERYGSVFGSLVGESANQVDDVADLARSALPA